MMKPFYLGDPQFSRKISKLYGWILPVSFLLMSGLMMVAKAWLPAGCFLIDALLSMPVFKEFLAGYKIQGMVKVGLGICLVFAALYSAGVYL